MFAALRVSISYRWKKHIALLLWSRNEAEILFKFWIKLDQVASIGENSIKISGLCN